MASVEQYFVYKPVHGAPEAAAVVCAIVIVIVALQTLNTGAESWIYLLVGTAATESLGFILRSICVSHPSLALYILQSICLLLAPHALSLFNFIAVSKVSECYTQPLRRFWLRPWFIRWVIFAVDVSGVVLRVVGGAVMAKEQTNQLGRWVNIIGHVLQMLVLTAFLIVVLLIRRDFRYRVFEGPNDVTWIGAKKRLMQTIVSTTLLLYGRAIYQLVECIDSRGYRVYSNEWMVYVFDFAVVLLALLINTVFYIGYHFPRRRSASGSYRLHYLGVRHGSQEVNDS